MSDEKPHPNRKELFYYGRLLKENEAEPEGLETVRIENQHFVTVTYEGEIKDIWKGYGLIHQYLKDHSLIEDKDSYVVELYDHRFNPESENSKMEIFIPIKK